MKKAKCRMQAEWRKDQMALPNEKNGGLRFLACQAGFSLIEVMIAIAVFAIGILAVASMQETAVGGNAKAHYISEATGWAVDRMETLLNLDYDDPLLDDSAGTNAGIGGLDDGLATGTTADGTSTSADGNYTILWNVAKDEPLPSLESIRVIVTHNLLDNPVVLDFYKVEEL